jgi:hypothetical protein
MWDRDPVLLQLPHVSRDLAKRAAEGGIEAIFDLMEMEDDERNDLLQMTPKQLADVARACNRYPNVEVRDTRCRHQRPRCPTRATHRLHAHTRTRAHAHIAHARGRAHVLTPCWSRVASRADAVPCRR